MMHTSDGRNLRKVMKLLENKRAANCHLANKPVDIEVPQAVLLDTVIEAVVRILYDVQVKQVLANGKKGL
ncbi:hypothetical protein P8452_18730 [Trifolium repens]|nr:hypothetical protein P8452_18730 [Trifolium repens]